MPTNVISITDGQIFLDTDLFNSGIRPAINAGLSVSRVGGAAQTKIIKKYGGGLRLALAQYRELEAFSQFASDLDDATRKQLERGKRAVETLKQKQYTPLNVAEMSICLFSVDQGYLDDIEVSKVVAFNEALLSYLRDKHASLFQEINNNPSPTDEMITKIKTIIKEFKKTQTW